MNPKDVLPDFIREALEGEPADREGVEALLVAITDATGTETPPAALRKRILAAATKGSMRFAPFFDELGRLFDLGVDAVMRVLDRAADESQWEPGPHPSIRIFHLAGGPLTAGADTGFVSMPAGFEFPLHRHSAAERVLILEGGYKDADGRVYRAGDVHEMAADTEHAFSALPDGPLVFALVLHGPIAML
jgi:hypothetical protein